MEWTVTSSEIWLTSVDITWTREYDGINQRLCVMVHNEVMYCRAYQWTTYGSTRSFYMEVDRQHIINNKEVSELFNTVYFNGTAD